LQKTLQQNGPAIFERALPFSEMDALKMLLPYIKSHMKFVEVSVVSQQEATEYIEKNGEDVVGGWEKARVDAALPTQPEIVFWNVTA
jgi:hypothetical protein